MTINGSVYVGAPPPQAEDAAWPLRSDVFAEAPDVDRQAAAAERDDESTAESHCYATDSPQARASYVGELDVAGEAYLDESSRANHQSAIAEEAFPSGLELSVFSGAVGRNEEHWDPNDVGLPLYDTGSAFRSRKLSRSFTVGELASSGGRPEDAARISLALVRCLQLIRDRAGRPVKVTSGYRSWRRNVELYRRAGKSPTRSRHCSGQAADITISGMSGLQIAKLAIDSCGSTLGIGVGKSFAHIDVRGTSTVWTYDGLNQARVRSELDAHRRGAQPGPAPKSAGHVPPHVTEFVRTYRPHAQRSEARSRVPWLVTLAQGAVESAWGKRMCGNNMFGIKAKATHPESQRTLCTTKEVHRSPRVVYPEVISVTPRSDGRYDYVVRDWFRVFTSPADSFDAHAKVLQHPRYAKAFAHTNDPYAFADEVAAGGYATAPNYAAALKGVMKLIEKVP